MDYLSIHKEAQLIKDKLVDWRREFHKYPELGLHCKRTASLVADELDNMGFTVQTGLAETGIAASIGYGEKAVAIRVDMDALPITEKTGLPFASVNNGAMHACGHDGHTAIGLGVAHMFSRLMPVDQGKLLIAFQPGEEYPGGAALMINEGAFMHEKPSMILGMHIFPELPSGKIGLRYGIMTASNLELKVVFNGLGGHCAYPHRAIDPYPALASFIDAIQTIVSRNKPPLEPQVISLGEIRGGDGYNVIPGEIKVKGTIRSVSENAKNEALKRIKEIARGLETTYQVKISVEVAGQDPMLKCDVKITELAERILKETFNSDTVIRIEQPSMGVDDFAHFANLYPATYLRLGSFDRQKGYIYPLHNDKFDFDEALLIKGVEAAVVVLSAALLK